MLWLFWFAFLALGACVILAIPFLVGQEFHKMCQGARAVKCPQTHGQVAVEFDAFHAAVTRLAGEPRLRVVDCTRWPEHRDCGQECVAEASAPLFYSSRAVSVKSSKQIYHSPVLIAAFVAWALGAVWHSHYFFRPQWTEALGITQADVHQLVWRLAPHMLTVAIPLLFAYGVAWWLSWSEKKSAGTGVGLALLLWGLISGLTVAIVGVDGISAVFAKLELIYTFLASVIIGAHRRRFHPPALCAAERPPSVTCLGESL
jgi:hypothetical protein